MKRYEVLWIDDDAEKQDGFLDSAFLEGIDLNYFKTSKLGVEELSVRIEYYDAVILDARVFNESEDEVPSLLGLLNSIKKINSLSDRKKIPYFIFSGYIDQDEYASAREMLADETIFIKGKDNDNLFKAIKASADQQLDTQIRHKFSRVFEVCTETYIGENAGRDLLTLFLSGDINTEGGFNLIRKIIEDIFIAFNKYQLLPSEFVTPSVSLNESSRFLSGKVKDEIISVKGYKHQEGTHLPEQISTMLWSILSITQNGSHRSTIDEHVKNLNTSYLLESVTFQLLDVLVWFKIHIDSNPKIENWISEKAVDSLSDTQRTEGVVINHNVAGGFAFLKPHDGSDNIFIPPHLVTNNALSEGDQIKGTFEDYIDNRSGDKKTRVNSICN